MKIRAVNRLKASPKFNFDYEDLVEFCNDAESDWTLAVYFSNEKVQEMITAFGKFEKAFYAACAKSSKLHNYAVDFEDFKRGLQSVLIDVYFEKMLSNNITKEQRNKLKDILMHKPFSH